MGSRREREREKERQGERERKRERWREIKVGEGNRNIMKRRESRKERGEKERCIHRNKVGKGIQA